ncbi:MAG: 1,4-dihydroxy-2-naphthoate polyprenyltransferase [Caldilineales bacterium]|nr:1,4-dihydroxy-2-naphthoate polyprenyltransferase [Caldilineales bacterium]MDW8317821.1 1,4-dihydroxy-2-naphthoate polyprenyltransferase [Anaerolineae bacterium]
MSASRPPLSRRQAWWLAIRPRTLPAAVGPILVGAALAIAAGAFRPLVALVALAVALLLQIASNLANDYYDFVKGYDQADRKGPLRVAASGLLPLNELRRGLLLVLALAALLGSYLIYVGGWPILLLGAAALLAAVIYSGGPFPLAAHGLGDLFVFLFFGLAAVVGTFYLQAGTAPSPVWLVAVAPGALVTAILVVNNLRDMESDRRVGKRTLAVRLGAQGTRREYDLLLLAAYAVPVAMLALELARDGGGAAGLRWLLPWLTLPQALRLRQALTACTDGPAMNRALAGTARLSLIFSVLLAVAIALPALWAV